MNQSVMFGANGYNVQPVSLVIAVMMMILTSHFIATWILTTDSRWMWQSAISNSGQYSIVSLASFGILSLPVFDASIFGGFSLGGMVIIHSVINSGLPDFWYRTIARSHSILTTILTIGAQSIGAIWALIKPRYGFFIKAFAAYFSQHFTSNKRAPLTCVARVVTHQATSETLRFNDTRVLNCGQLLGA